MIEKRLPDLRTRMRRRRAQLGLTGTELAQRAGISTSYVSLIETGAKVPEEERGGRPRPSPRRRRGTLPRLGARGATRESTTSLSSTSSRRSPGRRPTWTWSRAGKSCPGRGRPAQRPARARPSPISRRGCGRWPRASGPRRFSPAVPADRRALDESPRRRRLRSWRSRSWPREAIPPPWGPRARPVDRLILDRRLVEGLDPQELFAYEVTPAATKHLRGVAAPGDRVVLRRQGAVTPDRICAIRTERGIVLSRALVKEGSLLLLPGEGEVDFESVELPEPADVGRRRGHPRAADTEVIMGNGAGSSPLHGFAGVARPALARLSARPGRGRRRDGVVAGDLRRPDPAGRLGRVVPRHEPLLPRAGRPALVVRMAAVLLGPIVGGLT